ncbi:membrane protein [Mycobacterium sp. SWH-M3]|nr:membrane protein [Mycobacterium sp. SWH-M3]
MIIWVIAGLLGLATGLRIGWALVNKQSLVSSAMILALGSLGAVAAFNWQPLALLTDTLLHWPNIAMAFSQVALIACAAGSCVMITTAASDRPAAISRRIAIVQYGVAAVVAVVSLAAFFLAGRQPEMAPGEYLQRNLGGNGTTWLLPLLYVLLALTLVTWAGVRYSNRSRRGRALFVFTIGIVLIVAASGFFLIRVVSRTNLVSVGAAVTILGCAMVIVAMGSLLPSIEDWFGARQELRVIAPLLAELGRRQPDVGIGVRPRGPLVFRVAERMSLISDSLYLEATAAATAARNRESVGPRGSSAKDDRRRKADPANVSPTEQARVVAQWIYETRGDDEPDPAAFPGLTWLRQPESYSDREWILAIGEQYRALEKAKHAS